jgi:crotonobetainyl-CoA:carnitine CoA-transferase CaiB-like acyl-CoA transferase
MFDAVFGLLSARVAEAANTVPHRGLERPGNGRYRTHDRLLYVSTVHDKWFRDLCEVLFAPELAEDPRFTEARARVEHSRELHRELEARLVTRDAEDWQRELNARGIPAAVVRTLAEAVRHPQVEHRRLLREVFSPSGAVTVMGPLRVVRRRADADSSTDARADTRRAHRRDPLGARLRRCNRRRAPLDWLGVEANPSGQGLPRPEALTRLMPRCLIDYRIHVGQGGPAVHSSR